MNDPGWFSFSKCLGVSAPLVALVVASPILVIAASVFSIESAAIWSHLRDTVLADYVMNSVLLMLGVGVLTLVLGVPAAWYTAVCEFPGRSVFVWALLLPLAFPAYIIAYTYTGLLEFAGPAQTLLRDLTRWKYGDYWFFPIRSLGGEIVEISFRGSHYLVRLEGGQHVYCLAASHHSREISDRIGMVPKVESLVVFDRDESSVVFDSTLDTFLKTLLVNPFI